MGLTTSLHWNIGQFSKRTSTVEEKPIYWRKPHGSQSLVMGSGAFHFEVMGSNWAQFGTGQKLKASKGFLWLCVWNDITISY